MCAKSSDIVFHITLRQFSGAERTITRMLPQPPTHPVEYFVITFCNSIFCRMFILLILYNMFYAAEKKPLKVCPLILTIQSPL